MSTTFYAKVGDTLPVLSETLFNADATAIDLTDATVEFHLRAPDGTVAVSGAATVAGDPTTGVVSYAWQAGDLDTAGSFKREWEITFPSGKVLTVPNTRVGYVVKITDEIA